MRVEPFNLVLFCFFSVNGHVNGHFSNGPTVAQVLQAATAKSQAAKSETSDKDGFRRPAQLKVCSLVFCYRTGTNLHILGRTLYH